MLSYFSHVTGTSGTPVSSNANYFTLPTKKNWQLCQYHVSFIPSEDSKAAKHKMVRDHTEKLGGYLFDGTKLYTSYLYDENVSLIFFLFIICIMILK
jgi:aubergine-like protein